MGDAAEVFAEGAAALAGAGADFMLVGATAFGAYTLPRTTYDVDFLVGDDDRVRAALRRRFALVEETHDPVFDQRAWVVEVGVRVTPLEHPSEPAPRSMGGRMDPQRAIGCQCGPGVWPTGRHRGRRGLRCVQMHAQRENPKDPPTGPCLLVGRLQDRRK